MPFNCEDANVIVGFGVITPYFNGTFVYEIYYYEIYFK
jgi:hypothetical protein